jgi:hypothetical protein
LADIIEKKMKKENIKSNLVFLDTILKNILDNSINYEIEYDELFIKTFKISFFEEKSNFKSKIVSFVQSKKNLWEYDFELPEKYNSNNAKYLKALDFLEKNELIKLNENVSITYLGIIKLSKDGFHGEYKMEKKSKCLQKLVWIVSILTFGIVLWQFISKINLKCI